MPQWINSLRTRTPQEGFELAIKLAQKGIEYTQPNENVRKVLRPMYSRNPDNLIASSEVIAIHYQTVAAANDYWHGDTHSHYRY